MFSSLILSEINLGSPHQSDRVWPAQRSWHSALPRSWPLNPAGQSSVQPQPPVKEGFPESVSHTHTRQQVYRCGAAALRESLLYACLRPWVPRECAGSVGWSPEESLLPHPTAESPAPHAPFPVGVSVYIILCLYAYVIFITLFPKTFHLNYLIYTGKSVKLEKCKTALFSNDLFECFRLLDSTVHNIETLVNLDIFFKHSPTGLMRESRTLLPHRVYLH